MKIYLIMGLIIGAIVFVLNNQTDNSVFYAKNISDNGLVTVVDASEENVLIDEEQFLKKCTGDSEYYKITLDNDLNIETCQSWPWTEIPRRVQDVFTYME